MLLRRSSRPYELGDLGTECFGLRAIGDGMGAPHCPCAIVASGGIEAFRLLVAPQIFAHHDVLSKNSQRCGRESQVSLAEVFELNETAPPSPAGIGALREITEGITYPNYANQEFQ
jgi:hypothetical protein